MDRHYNLCPSCGKSKTKRSYQCRKCLGSPNKGKKFSKEYKLVLSIAAKNKYKSGFVHPFLGKKRSEDEESWNWKGDDVGYRGIHKWVEKHRGKPTKCEHCKKDGLIGHQVHWANKSGKYFRDLKDWIRLCAKCHKLLDLNRNKEYEIKKI